MHESSIMHQTKVLIFWQDNDKVGMIQSERERKLKDLEQHVDKMRNQQDILQKKLKSEADHKMKVERELEREHLKIKELEEKHIQQQKMLKRKTEEVVAAQRKLRTVKKQGSDDRPDRSGSKFKFSYTVV